MAMAHAWKACRATCRGFESHHLRQYLKIFFALIAQRIEYQFPELRMEVQFPLRAPRVS